MAIKKAPARSSTKTTGTNTDLAQRAAVATGEAMSIVPQEPGKVQSRFMRWQEVASVLGCSRAYAYETIRRMNAVLEKRGFFTFDGRVLRRFFYEAIGDKP